MSASQDNQSVVHDGEKSSTGSAKPAQEGDLQHEFVLAAARKRGISITDVSDKMFCKAALLELNGQVELLVQGIISSAMHLKTKHLLDFKQLTKYMLRQLQIPSPESMLFSNPDDPGLKDFIQPGRQYVCKPQVAANGMGVEMDITSFQQVRDYWDRCQHLDRSFLLEEQIEGTDLRIQVIGRCIAACCIRVPAHVIGDGRHTLMQLVEFRREVMRNKNPSDRLELDRASLALIDEQGLSLDSVPEIGQQVQLKTVSNMGQGGHAIDVTDEIHPHYHDWVRQIVDYCDASYFALDLICQDHIKDPETHAIALEVNSLAEWTHHAFSERRTHDLGTLVIDTTFAI